MLGLFAAPVYGGATPQALALHPGENVVTAAVYDPIRDVAYFAVADTDFRYSLEMASGTLVRVRLSDFKRTGTLKLRAGENAIHAALLDAAGANGYLGIYGDPNRDVPAQVVHVNLSQWRRVGSAPLGKQEFGISSAIWGTSDGEAYWGTLYGSIVRMNLPSMTATAALSLQRENNAFQCGVTDPDGQTGYFGTASGNVMKIRLSDFLPLGNVSVSQAQAGFRAVVADPSGRYLYWAAEGMPGRIVRLSLERFQISGILEIPDEKDFVAAFVGPKSGTASFITGGQNPSIIEVDLETFQETGRLPLSESDGSAHCGFYSSKEQAVVVGMDGEPAQLVKVDYPGALRPSRDMPVISDPDSF